MLPIANTRGSLTPPLTAFFTAASAVSTTGLTLVPTATYWTLFGQAVICALIFLGGLGLVTVVMFNLWLIGTRFTLQDRILTREAMAGENLGGLVHMLRNVVLLDLAITAIGAGLLIWPFQNYYDLPTSLWQALFHSVSAFNTAGFDIVGPASFIPFRTDIILLSIPTVEAVLGAISFSVLMEVPMVHRWHRFSLNTKLVLVMTLVVSLLAIMAILINETFLGNTLADFSIAGKAFTSFFNGLSASTTTGFSTIDFSQVTIQVLLIITGVMFIGGATGSTAGGIKVNTFATIVANIWSTVRGKTNTEIFGREIGSGQVLRALTVVFVSFTLVVFGMLLIMISSPDVPFERVLFEATSAFGTVGLSTGALAKFSTLGKIVVIFLMFVGRVTPLSVTMIFARYRKHPAYRYPQELVKIG
jgi:trk system potassium uptake protein TrkH